MKKRVLRHALAFALAFTMLVTVCPYDLVSVFASENVDPETPEFFDPAAPVEDGPVDAIYEMTD